MQSTLEITSILEGNDVTSGQETTQKDAEAQGQEITSADG